MVNVEVLRNAEGKTVGFNSYGHAGYDVKGKDIVCAAVSVLLINTVNSVEALTDDEFSLDSDEEKGKLNFCIKGVPSREAVLFLNSLELGLIGVRSSYGTEYIELSYKEV